MLSRQPGRSQFVRQKQRSIHAKRPQNTGNNTVTKTAEHRKQHGHYYSENTSNLMNLASGSLFLWERLFQVPSPPTPDPAFNPPVIHPLFGRLAIQLVSDQLDRRSEDSVVPTNEKLGSRLNHFVRLYTVAIEQLAVGLEGSHRSETDSCWSQVN